MSRRLAGPICDRLPNMARLLDTMRERRRLQLLDAPWRQRRIRDVGIDGAGVISNGLCTQQFATPIATTHDVPTRAVARCFRCWELHWFPEAMTPIQSSRHHERERTASSKHAGTVQSPITDNAVTGAEAILPADYRVRAPAMQVLQGSSRSWLTQLPIASFTVVMAAAILSLAASDASQVDLAAVLRGLAIVMFGVLVSLHAARVLLHPRVNATEAGHPETAFDAFSLVAATAVTAVALAPLFAGWLLAVIWGCTVLLWLTVVAMTSQALFQKRDLGLVRFASGRWLLGVVSIEAVAVLGTSLTAATHSAAASVGALAAWALGLVAYPVVALAIALRLHSRGWQAMDVTPDHWILMRALAICTLAATDLATSPGGDLIRDIHGGVADVAWVTWSGAGALYVLLAAATFRRWIAWRRRATPRPSLVGVCVPTRHVLSVHVRTLSCE